MKEKNQTPGQSSVRTIQVQDASVLDWTFYFVHNFYTYPATVLSQSKI